MTYLTQAEVEVFLKALGGNPFTVAFDKQDGGHRIITGILAKPIDGPLAVNVVVLTEEGYKSFNSGKVTQIAKVMMGVDQ